MHHRPTEPLQGDVLLRMTQQSTEEGMKLPLWDVKEVVVSNKWKCFHLRGLPALPSEPLFSPSMFFKGWQMRSTAKTKSAVMKYILVYISLITPQLPLIGIHLMGWQEQRDLATSWAEHTGNLLTALCRNNKLSINYKSPFNNATFQNSCTITEMMNLII